MADDKTLPKDSPYSERAEKAEEAGHVRIMAGEFPALFDPRRDYSQIGRDQENVIGNSGVAEKSDRPFVQPPEGGDGKTATRYIDHTRPYVVEREDKIRDLMGTILEEVKKKALSLLPGVEKADSPFDDFDLEDFLEALALDVIFGDYSTDLEEMVGEVVIDAAQEAWAIISEGDRDEGIVERLNDRAIEWAREHVGQLLSVYSDDPSIVDSTRDMIGRVIVEGMESNMSMPDIGKALEDSYAFSEDRARIIAATEITSANSHGSLESYFDAKRNGVKVKKSWLRLEDACRVCVENEEAGTIELEEPFPSGDMAPGAHPNCRCVIVPEVG